MDISRRDDPLLSDSWATSRIRLCLTCLRVFCINEAMLNAREFRAASYECNSEDRRRIFRRNNLRANSCKDWRGVWRSNQRACSPELPLLNRYALENHTNVTSTADREIDNELDFQRMREREKKTISRIRYPPHEERERDSNRAVCISYPVHRRRTRTHESVRVPRLIREISERLYLRSTCTRRYY